MRIQSKDVKVITTFMLLFPLISIAAVRFFLRAREQLRMPSDMWE